MSGRLPHTRGALAERYEIDRIHLRMLSIPLSGRSRRHAAIASLL